VSAAHCSITVRQSQIANALMRSLGGLLSLLAGVGLVLLAILNPQMDDFEDFAAKHLRAQVADRLEKRLGNESTLGRLLAGPGMDLASRYLDRFSTRKNYVVASVYTVDLDGPDANELEWRFLGIGGRFVPLEGPQEKEKNAENQQPR
jgi:hypothetical protein